MENLLYKRLPNNHYIQLKITKYFNFFFSNSYVNETIGQIDDYVNRVINYTENYIGRCEPLSNSFNATVVSVCNEILDPFNGFWASIGWCYLFYLPSIALAIGKSNL